MFTKDNRGIAAILTVIIVSAAALIMAFSASVLGIGDLDMGYTSQKGKQALALATGCAEESLHRLESNASWVGGTLNLTDGQCVINVVSNSTSRTITVSASVDNFNKQLQIQATVSNNLVTLVSWKEI